MFEISQLLVFTVAAEEQNFSRAAQRLHISQSAVSQTIQAFERKYNITLFERRGRSIVLSDTGLAILPMAREVINAVRLLEETLLNAHEEVTGELLLGCSTSAGKYILPILLADFQRQYPATFPHVRILNREAVISHLLDHSIPFGIVSRQIEHHNLECLPLFEDKIILITPPNHPWAKFGRAQVEDLLDQPLIIREESSGTREAVDEALRRIGIDCSLLQVRMELDNPEAIVHAVERGVGIAFVSKLVAARSFALGRIKQVEIEGISLQRTIFIARLLNYPLTRVQALFWEYLVQRRSELQKWIENANESPAFPNTSSDGA